jgi:hypothetical protein
MAMSPEVMGALKGPGPQQAGKISDGGPAPGPMMSPSKAGGHTAGAKAAVMVAMKVLEQTLPQFGAMTDEGKAVLSCLKSLGKAFGEQESKDKELMPAEITQLLAGLAGPGAPNAGQPGPPPGGAPPPGAPPPGGAPPPM